MARFIPPIVHLALDAFNGPASGYKLDFFASGTLIRKDTFSDNALTVANSNPVIANSAGRFGPIFLGSGEYRVKLLTDQDVEVWDADPVEGTPGASGSVDEKTEAYTVTLGDATKVIAVDASGGAVTITLLPAATAGDGFEITVKKVDSSANAVTVDADGSELIDGAANYALSLQYQSVILRSDGAGWHVRGGTRVKTGDIDALAVTTAKIAADAVTAPKLDRSLFRGFKSGLVPSNNGTDADHDLDFTAGVAWARDGSDVVEVAALTKQLDAAFAEGTGAGALGDTVSLPTSGTIHLFAIKKDADGTGDILADTSVSGANVPSGWTVIRRIGSWITDGSANLRPLNVVELAGGALQVLKSVPALDINASNPGTSAVLATLSVPAGIKVLVEASVNVLASTSTNINALVTSPDQADTAASSTMFTLRTNVNSTEGETVRGLWRTNTSRQVRYRLDNSAASDNIKIFSNGWIDPLES